MGRDSIPEEPGPDFLFFILFNLNQTTVVMKRFLLASVFALVAAGAFVGCSDDKDDAPVPDKYDVISFKDALTDPDGGVVQLGEGVLVGDISGGTFQNFYWTKSFSGYEDYLQNGAFNGRLFGAADGSVWFGSYYSTSSYGDYWGGFVLSGTFGTTATVSDYAYQFTAWVNKGVGDSSRCAIGYIDTYTNGYAVPTVELTSPRTIVSCHLAPSAMVALYTPTEVSKENLWFKMIVTGYLDGAETGKAECFLVENGTVKSGWNELDLSKLGRVDKLLFTFDSNDVGISGVNTPGYFALGGLTFVKE